MNDERPALEVHSTFQKRPAYRYIRASDKLPTYAELPNGETTTNEQIICKIKLFNPTGPGTWWLAAYDPETGIGWGVAEIHEREVGSFYLPELVEFRGRFGLPIERDLHWKPQTMAQVLGISERTSAARPPQQVEMPSVSEPGRERAARRDLDEMPHAAVDLHRRAEGLDGERRR